MHIRLSAGPHAVLLIHGLYSNPGEMRYVGQRLHKAGFSVSIPHFSGYGHPLDGAGIQVRPWQTWVTQVHEEVKRLRASHATVSLGGLCIGAVLALMAASECGEDIAAISLMAPTLAFDGWALPWYRIMAPLAFHTPLRRHYSFPESEPFGLKNHVLRTLVAREMQERGGSITGPSAIPLDAIYQAHRLIKQTRKALCNVRVPALILHSREDDVASIKSATLVAERISSHETRLVVLHDSYHMVTLDNDRNKVADESAQFFSRFAHAPPVVARPLKIERGARIAG